VLVEQHLPCEKSASAVSSGTVVVVVAKKASQTESSSPTTTQSHLISFATGVDEQKFQLFSSLCLL